MHFVGNKAKGRISKTNISYPLIPTRTYVNVSVGKKCLFFGKFGVPCFFETPVLRCAFLSYYQRVLHSNLARVCSLFLRHNNEILKHKSKIKQKKLNKHLSDMKPQHYLGNIVFSYSIISSFEWSKL